MLVTIMPRRRRNRISWTATIFWLAYFIIMIWGCWFLVHRFTETKHEVQYVSSCPRLPYHQQQGPVFT